MRDRLERLIDKYRVERVNDAEGKHSECRFFVLDPRHDRIAVYALMRYAQLAHARGHRALAEDLWKWIEEVQSDDEHYRTDS